MTNKMYYFDFGLIESPVETTMGNVLGFPQGCQMETIEHTGLPPIDTKKITVSAL